MSEAPRTIFRSDAITRYAEARQQDVLPRLIRPRYFLYQWGMLFLIGIAALAAWLTPVPLWVRGEGLLHPTQDTRTLEAVVFLAPSTLPNLQEGQTLTLTLADGQRINATAVRVEHDVSSPASVRARFGDAAVVAAPVVVVTTTFPASALSGTASQYADARLMADLQIGTRPVLSFLPGMDRVMEQ